LEENFEQAVEHATKWYSGPKTYDEVSAVLKDSKADKLSKDSTNFWILVNALKGFIAAEGNGSFPGSTAIPDMVAESDSYVKLKSIYKDKADADLASIAKRVQQNLASIGRKDEISADEIANFVKNCRNLKVVRTRPISAEYDSKTFNTATISSALEDEKDNDKLKEEDKNTGLYFAMRAVDAFVTKTKRQPKEDDAAAVKKIADGILKDLELVIDATNWIAEIIRAEQAELHNVGAFMGGVVSQEALKILIRQYVPMNNLFVYNGQTGRASRFEV